MASEQVLYQITGNKQLSATNVDDISAIVRAYPYFSPAQFLLALKQKQDHSYNYQYQLQKASLYFSNPIWLNFLLSEKEVEAPVLSEVELKHLVQPSNSNEGAKENIFPTSLLGTHPVNTVVEADEHSLWNAGTSNESTYAYPEIDFSTSETVGEETEKDAEWYKNHFSTPKSQLGNIEVPSLEAVKQLLEGKNNGASTKQAIISSINSEPETPITPKEDILFEPIATIIHQKNNLNEVVKQQENFSPFENGRTHEDVIKDAESVSPFSKIENDDYHRFPKHNAIESTEEVVANSALNDSTSKEDFADSYSSDFLFNDDTPITSNNIEAFFAQEYHKRPSRETAIEVDHSNFANTIISAPEFESNIEHASNEVLAGVADAPELDSKYEAPLFEGNSFHPFSEPIAGHSILSESLSNVHNTISFESFKKTNYADLIDFGPDDKNGGNVVLNSYNSPEPTELSTPSFQPESANAEIDNTNDAGIRYTTPPSQLLERLRQLELENEEEHVAVVAEPIVTIAAENTTLIPKSKIPTYSYQSYNESIALAKSAGNNGVSVILPKVDILPEPSIATVIPSINSPYKEELKPAIGVQEPETTVSKHVREQADKLSYTFNGFKEEEKKDVANQTLVAAKLKNTNNNGFSSEELLDEDSNESEEEANATDGELSNTHLSSIISSQMVDFKKPVAKDAKLEFEQEHQHTIDYFASLGIKIDLTLQPQDKLTMQLRRFTDWLKQMKKVETNPQDLGTDPELEKAIQNIAQTSIEAREIVTETMADIFVKQGKINKAIQLYIKLSFLEPNKSTYFAARIQQLKGI